MATDEPEGKAAAIPHEGRISVLASKGIAKDTHSAITNRRISLHLERRSNQNLLATNDDGEETEKVLDGEGEGKEEEEEEGGMGSQKQPPGFEMTTLKSEGQRELYALVTSYVWELIILTVVILNSSLLVVEASVNIKARAGWYLDVLETVFIGVFVSEAIVMLYVFRLRYFLNYWNILDFFIVIVIMADIIMSVFNSAFAAYGPTTVLRLLRIIRALQALRVFQFLKTFRFFSTLQVILTTLRRSAKPMGIIALMMAYVIYLFSVIGRGLYGELDYRFRSIPKTMYTLYLMLTLDDWYFIPLAVESKGVYHCFFYFFVYIFVNVYILLGVFVAVICDNFQSAWLEEKEFEREKKLMHTGSFANMQEELEEHDDDDEDSLLDAVISGNDVDSDFDPIDPDLHINTIEEYYPEASKEECRVLEQFFDVAAALENNYFKLLEMQHVLDMMVDVAADASDDPA